MFLVKNGRNSTKLRQVYTVCSAMSVCIFLVNMVPIFEPAHKKTYNKTCVTSKDSDQPLHPRNMARVLICYSLNSLEAV